MNDSLVFVDTNLLVYLRDPSEPEKHAVAQDWLSALAAERRITTSTQVLNEYFVTVTRKLSQPLSPEEAWLDMESFSVWNPLPVSMATLRLAKEVQSDYQFSWWDSLIVASAKQSKSHFLLTEDLTHEQKLGDLTIINPMLTELEGLR